VPALLAVWPQSAFYSIQGDALSPICFGIAFLGLVQILQRERVGILLPIWTGLFVAATCLIKTSNFPLPVVATILVGFKALHRAKKGQLQSSLTTIGVFILAVVLPLATWFAWNYQNFGDLTATKSKIELLGWTRKPFREWLPHPIFTIHGFREFWGELSASFWRGEFVWHLERMASGFADAFYAVSTAFVIVAAFFLMLRGKIKDQQLILWLALLSFVSIVPFLVLLSIGFDFGRCPYPSREHPYFTSGRLLNATAVPFFILFVYVIDCVTSWTKRNSVRWIVLGAAVLLLIGSQLQVN